MTFNLRYASEAPPHPWRERRPAVRALLRGALPHLLGTQEGLPAQLQDLQEDLPAHYESIGQGREGGAKGEAMQVFFDSRRLEPLAHGHYWLSDTPDVPGSRSWGEYPRMVTWIRFRDRSAGCEFLALNTHLEAYDPEARRKAAELILARLAGDLPVIVTGDFNEPAGPGHAVYDHLVTHGPLVDSWERAARRGPSYKTFHGFGPLTPGGDRIDWILTSPAITILEASVNPFAPGGRHPSDHLPVQAAVELPGSHS